MDEDLKAKNPIQVIDRAARLISILAEKDGRSTLKVLSKISGLHASTVYRIMDSMIQVGWVERNAANEYILGATLIQLGQIARSALSLAEIARPYVRDLREQINETVNLLVRSGDDVVIIDRSLSKKSLIVAFPLGKRMPLHASASGKLYLSFYPELLQDYLARVPLKAVTPLTTVQVEKLRRELIKVREEGVAFSREDLELGLTGMAMPIFNGDNEMIGALAISAPAQRFDEKWQLLLTKTTTQISQQVGLLTAD